METNSLDFETLRRERNKVFKELFSGTIKESFLVSTLSRIENDFRYNGIILGNFNPERDLSIKSTILGRNYSELAICKMIVMNHYMNTFQLDDRERGKRQSDNSYIDLLVTQSINELCLEKVAAPDFSIFALEPYLPIIYFVSALNNLCASNFASIKSGKATFIDLYNKPFNIDMLYKLIFRIKSCVALVAIGSTDELMAIFRSLSELFMIYALLWDKDEKVINRYREHDKATFAFNRGEEVSKEIEIIAKKSKNKVKYYNYGWLDSLEEFNAMDANKRDYTLTAIAELLDIKYGKNFGLGLYRHYKSCNPHTHGTTIYMNYFHLELVVFQNIAVMLTFICKNIFSKISNCSFIVGNIDLLDELEYVKKQARLAMEFLNDNENALEKSNNDFVKRFYCQERLKNKCL